MIFTSTRFEDALLIDIEPKEDERGFFARTWCREELATRGLDAEIAQESVSYNRFRGTVRGLHFQRPPHEETKIVRCTRGAIFPTGPACSSACWWARTLRNRASIRRSAALNQLIQPGPAG